MQKTAYGRWDPSLSLMVVRAPSQAGTEPRIPTGSRLQTRQRAGQVSSEIPEKAPTTVNHFVMSFETSGANCTVNETHGIMRGQGTPFKLQSRPTVYTQHHLAPHFSLVVVGSFRTWGRAKAPQLHASARGTSNLDADARRVGTRRERRDGEVIFVRAVCETSMCVPVRTNAPRTRSVIWMDRTPVEAPYGRAGVEHMGAAFGQELGCDSLSTKVSPDERVTLHNFCAWSISSLTLVCPPNGPKSQDTGEAAAPG
jgi:hypothetical protein